MKKSYDRKLELICPACASTQFKALSETQTPEALYECIACGEVFRHDQIIDGNSARIDATLDEIKSEVVKDFKKKISGIFKKYGK